MLTLGDKMSDNERTEFYKKQIELEESIIVAAKESIEGIKNNIIKDLILAIVYDSKKHKGFLNSLITLNSQTTPFIDDQARDKIAKTIQKHIDLEAKAIETYKEILTDITDAREKDIVNAIYQDELRHHSLLQRILKNIVELETLDKDEIYDWLMEDAIPRY